MSLAEDITSEIGGGTERTGKPFLFDATYEDKGVIKALKPQQLVQYTHCSPLAGLPDKPANYHTVTIELSSEGDRTRVTLSQDNNPTEQARDHSKKNWEMMLASLKTVIEE